AHVDHVEALLHRPAQSFDEGGPAADEPLAEDAHAHELAVRGDGSDDARARRPVAAHVADLVVLHVYLAVLHADGDRRVDASDETVAGVDAAVDDADRRTG